MWRIEQKEVAQAHKIIFKQTRYECSFQDNRQPDRGMTQEPVYRASVKTDVSDSTFENPSGKRNYNLQFNNIYKSRSEKLKSRVFKMAQGKWGQTSVNGTRPKYVNKILDAPQGAPCFLIGTVFAEMKYKPDVLREVELSVQGHSDIGKVDTKEMGKIELLRNECYSEPASDEFWLEDESGRILITGDVLEKAILVTGIVVGILGMEVESGVFHAVDIAYPEHAPQRPITQADGKILLCSGLNISESAERSKYEVFKSWVRGDLGDARARDIAHVVVTGNIVRATGEQNQKTPKNKYSEQFVSRYNREAMEYADTLFEGLCRSVPVTVLPGEGDVVEMGLPKQAIHHSLFGKASGRANFGRATDPTWMEMGGLRVLATAGENINDMVKYVIPNIGVDAEIGESVAMDSRLRLIEDSLLWQIVAPTAPDTLWCYPFGDEDPFTLSETPHVYVVGNQPKFETSEIELRNKNGETATVRVVALPAFSETGQCVLLDVHTLECTLVEIS